MAAFSHTAHLSHCLITQPLQLLSGNQAVCVEDSTSLLSQIKLRDLLAAHKILTLAQQQICQLKVKGLPDRWDNMLATYLSPLHRIPPPATAASTSLTEDFNNYFWPAKTLPPRGAGWEPERLAFQS